MILFDILRLPLLVREMHAPVLYEADSIETWVRTLQTNEYTSATPVSMIKQSELPSSFKKVSVKPGQKPESC